MHAPCVAFKAQLQHAHSGAGDASESDIEGNQRQALIGQAILRLYYTTNNSENPFHPPSPKKTPGTHGTGLYRKFRNFDKQAAPGTHRRPQNAALCADRFRRSKPLSLETPDDAGTNRFLSSIPYPILGSANEHLFILRFLKHIGVISGYLISSIIYV